MLIHRTGYVGSFLLSSFVATLVACSSNANDGAEAAGPGTSAAAALTSGPWSGAELRTKNQYGSAGVPVRLTWRARPASGNCAITLFSLFNADRIFAGQGGVWSELDFEVFGGTAGKGPISPQFQTQYITYNNLTDDQTVRGRSHAVGHFSGGNVANIWDGGFHTFQIEWLQGDTPDAYISYRLDGAEIRRETGGDVRRLEGNLTVYSSVWMVKLETKWGCFDNSDRPQAADAVISSFRVEKQYSGSAWTVTEDHPAETANSINQSFNESTWGFDSFDGSYCPSNAIPQSDGNLRLELDRHCGPDDPSPLTYLDVTRNHTLVVRHSGKCLDSPFGASKDGTKVEQWGCNGGDNQKWRLLPSSKGFYAVQNVASGLCLNLGPRDATGSSVVTESTCAPATTQGATQLVRLQPTADGLLNIVWNGTGQCTDVSGGAWADGAAVLTYACQPGSQNQEWTLFEAL